MSNFTSSADLRNILSGIQGDSQEQIEETGKVLSAEAALQNKALVTEALRVAEELFAKYHPSEALAQLWVDEVVLTAEGNEDGEAEVYRFDFKNGGKVRSELRTRNADPLSNLDIRTYVDRARDHVFTLREALRNEAARIDAKSASGQISEEEEDEMSLYLDRAKQLKVGLDKAIDRTMNSSGLDNLRELALHKIPSEFCRSGDKLDSNIHLLGLDGGYALDLSKALTTCEETGELVPAGGTMADWLVRPEVGFGETRKVGLSKNYITENLAPFEQYEDEDLKALSKEYRSLRKEVAELADRLNDALGRDDLTAMQHAVAESAVVQSRMAEIKVQLAEAQGHYASELVECSEVDTLMKAITNGDQEMESFLWEVAGRMIDGDQYPQKTFGFLGTGGSGKGTFLSLLESALGTYQVQIDHEGYFSSQQNNPEKVYALMARLVVIHEMETSDHIAAAQLKKATEQASARLNHSNEIVRSTQNTVVITMNNSFQLKRDGGVERRLVIVPFGREGTHESEARLEVEAALDGLVARYGDNWREHPEVQAYVLEQAILGYARMKTSHQFDLADDRVPAKVVAATQQFFEEADPISSAIEVLFEVTRDQTDEVLNAQVSTKVEEYIRQEIPGFELSVAQRKDLYSRLKDLGATKKATVRGPSGRGRGFSGVRLKEQDSSVKLEMNVDEESIAEALKK